MSQLRPIAKNSPESRRIAENAIDQAVFLNATDSLESLAAHWEDQAVIGLDTEFVRERTFFPRPGLIQLYDGQSISLIDPIGRDAHNELSHLMKNQLVTKVFHSVGEDLEIMQLVCGAVPEPLFDTQIAAAMLGFPLQLRYEVLVKDCFGAELEGGQARSDWCKRPLAAHLLKYAASDVAWLIELQQTLSESLKQCQRLSWLEEDCQRLVNASRDGDQRLPLLRVKGGGQLKPQGLAWLNELSAWRDRKARSRDLPRSFILKDDVLIEIADSAARDAGLQALNRLHPKDRRRHGESLEELLNMSPPEPLPRPAELERLDNDQRQQLKAAQARVRSLAEELQVDPALIASKRELTKLLFGTPPAWASGWRSEFIPAITGD
ncbi:MAG: ribonuclease D [Pseudomonadota bacterium]